MAPTFCKFAKGRAFRRISIDVASAFRGEQGKVVDPFCGSGGFRSDECEARWLDVV